MAGIVGIMGGNSIEVLKNSLLKISHRGQYSEKIVTGSNVVMAGNWQEIETGLQTTPFQSFCVWDGFVPEQPSPSKIKNWEQPFAVAAILQDQLFLARDPLGTKPLYYGQTEAGLVFASEVKALLPLTKQIFEFPPSHWYTPNAGFNVYYQLKSEKMPCDDPTQIVDKLREKLEKAVEQCCLNDEMGIWLSGGVDSSVIAALAMKYVKKLQSFVSGLEGAADILYGTQLAEHFGIKHHIIKVTLSDLIYALPEVIYYLESFDALLVRSSITNYLTSKVAADYVGGIFSGEGGDELFAGYDYIKALPLDEVPQELEDIVMRLHNTALQRVDRSSQANGLVAFTPFTNMDIVEYALKIPATYKLMQHGNEKIEKWILRKVVEGFIPDNVLWRKKAKFWQGAGVGELLAEHAEGNISESDFQRERTLPNGWKLNSKEELMYYRIFKEHFGELENLDWMGRTKGSPVQ